MAENKMLLAIRAATQERMQHLVQQVRLKNIPYRIQDAA